MPVLFDEAEMASRIETLDPKWILAFDQTLLVGDRAEAHDLLELIPDKALAASFSLHLKDFRFEALRKILASRRSHA
jgi:hypothetical protein